MRTIEVSEAMARQMVALIVPQWARCALYVAMKRVKAGHPLGNLATSDGEWKKIMGVHADRAKVLGHVLTQLGCSLPMPDPSRVTRPYGDMNPNARPQSKRLPYYHPRLADAELRRLIAAVTMK